MANRPIESTILSGANAAFVEELFRRYLESPGSVDPSWQSFFAEMRDGASASDLGGASWAPKRARAFDEEEATSKAPAAPIGEDAVHTATLDSIRALMMIRAYRVRGHLIANFDPLGLHQEKYHPELDPESYGFTEADYNRPIFIDNVLGMERATMREILDALHQTYCGNIGVEFMHMQDPDQKAWLQIRVESGRNQPVFTSLGKRTILERLSEAETFERFLHVKHPGTKRFGLDGGESLVPAIEQVLKRGSQLGVKEVVIGMSHRGRLNVLANVMKKPFTAIFSEFQGNAAHTDDFQGSGDVKYHLGASADREFDEQNVHLSLTSNPSHLEIVDPVVLGKTRAKQAQRKNEVRDQVLSVLMHGDAAFAGQGLVPESLELGDLQGYRCGGTIHFIVNNQIGFTTSPKFARGTLYPSDIAKGIQAPIFHVNGDDPEAVVHVAKIATEFRQEFHKDVIIDMFCYRRFGHNEGDEPAFTQPLMYKAIANHPTTYEVYAKKLVAEGELTEKEVQDIHDSCMQTLEADFEAAQHYKPNKADWLEGAWTGLGLATSGKRRGNTGIPLETLREIGKVLSSAPEEINVNRKLLRQLKTKQKMFESGEGIDWATAEALAFGSLLREGIPVRLSGQDCTRGTFSQRHAAFVDQETEAKYYPLDHLKEGQAPFEVLDSPLSEAGVLGFEYGYTMAEPNALVLWEAQFGDFANGAQVVIDQFIASAESKWMRMSGLVLLLPHGFEGQGPEHSSARLERYLQLCAEDNLQVANCTTPANYFHVLRRQIHRNFRKPLILMTPKSLLRHKKAVSTLEDMGPDSTFHRVLTDDAKLVAGNKVKRIVLCSGKVYYDLEEEREKRSLKDVALIRVEQVYPFPADTLAEEFQKYPNADVVWCQEEPKNMGAWTFLDRRLEEVLVEIKHKTAQAVYVGRKEAASPATGLLRKHNQEQAELVDAALTVG
ncbi:MAG: 2-oxoglutarate dehydrogenase E1 component [Alphaproteobacteria bacterium]|nr:2-oxoglutarate dehydrogenase E1 component [Alphaproteobacteria bacterium]